MVPNLVLNAIHHHATIGSLWYEYGVKDTNTITKVFMNSAVEKLKILSKEILIFGRMLSVVVF